VLGAIWWAKDVDKPLRRSGIIAKSLSESTKMCQQHHHTPFERLTVKNDIMTLAIYYYNFGREFLCVNWCGDIAKGDLYQINKIDVDGNLHILIGLRAERSIIEAG